MLIDSSIFLGSINCKEHQLLHFQGGNLQQYHVFLQTKWWLVDKLTEDAIIFSLQDEISIMILNNTDIYISIDQLYVWSF